MYPLAPLYRVGGIGLLLFLQAVLYGSGGYFLWLLGRRLRLARPVLVGLVLTYAAYPALLGANLFDFHPDALAIPLLFGAVLALEQRRWHWYWPAVVGALLVKDTAPLVVGALAISLLQRRHLAAALLTAGLSGLVLFGDLGVVIPALTHHQMAQWSYYRRWGATPTAGVENLLAHPWLWFAWAAQTRAWLYLGIIFGPLLVLPPLAGGISSGYLWPALALLEVNLLSAFPAQTSPFDEFTVLAIPFLFASYAHGLSRPLPLAREIPSLQRLAAVVSLLVVLGWEAHTRYFALPPNGSALTAAARLVPPRAPLTAQNFVLPHFADRRELFLPPLTGRTAPPQGYVLLDRAFSTGLLPPPALARYAAAVSLAPSCTLLFRRDGVRLFRCRPQGR